MKCLATVVFVCLLLGLYALLCQVDPSLLRVLCTEDGVVESIGAGCYMFAALFMFYAFTVSSNEENRFLGVVTQRNVWFGLLGILFFVCFAEEISWGQRFFGWDTPQILLDSNAQKETNIHNLWIFHSRNPMGERKTFWGMFLNMSRLLSVFWFLYCVLMPLFAVLSGKIKNMFRILGIPVPSLWFGVLFLSSFMMLHLFIRGFGMENPSVGDINEFKEMSYAFIFLLLAFRFARPSLLRCQMKEWVSFNVRKR